LFVVNAVPLTLIGWLYISLHSDKTVLGKEERPDSATVAGDRAAIAVVAVATIGLIGAYAWLVPWRCWGLWALIFDPITTLAARELTMKLGDSAMPARLYGVFANSVGPTFVFLCATRVLDGLVRRRVWAALGWLTVILVVVMALLIPAIKGMLMPTAVLLVVGALLLQMGALSRVGVLVLSIVGMGLSLTALEISREVFYGVGKRAYGFGVCARALGGCGGAERLVQSAKLREGALGLSVSRVELMERQLAAACGPELEAERFADWAELKPDWRTRAGARLRPDLGEGRLRQIGARLLAYGSGLYTRLWEVPMQVAAWHFLYVSEAGSPGWAGVSLPRKLVGETVNVPERVYQRYGVVYSAGDRTSTSTAPTSFLLAYPAYLGVGGLGLALMLVVGYDVVGVWLASFTEGHVRVAARGLFAVSALNMMSSDFVTVMLSHGGLWALGLVAVFALVARVGRSLGYRREGLRAPGGIVVRGIRRVQ
jgi:hypothetical protein